MTPDRSGTAVSPGQWLHWPRRPDLHCVRGWAPLGGSCPPEIHTQSSCPCPLGKEGTGVALPSFPPHQVLAWGLQWGPVTWGGGAASLSLSALCEMGMMCSQDLRTKYGCYRDDLQPPQGSQSHGQGGQTILWRVGPQGLAPSEGLDLHFAAWGWGAGAVSTSRHLFPRRTVSAL